MAALVLAVALLCGLPAAVTAEGGASGILGPNHDINAIQGPQACAECHEDSARIWALTLHHDVIKLTHRSEEGRAIAEKMQIKRIKGVGGLCVSCHYTVGPTEKRPKVIAGVSCESCHGASRDWIKPHSEFSGKEQANESPEEVKERWARSEEAGMIRPRNLYALAKNCQSCHAAAHEDLVNVGEHPTGGNFELLSWAMGEVRHNVWYTERNDEASVERRRMLYLAGLSLSLEISLQALSSVREPNGRYALELRDRAADTIAKLTEASRLLVAVPELRAMIDAARPQATNAEALRASAAAVAEQAHRLLRHDGSGMDALDPLLPGAGTYVGDVVDG